ncbi:MAG TPA: UDP-N-acetylglucosamine diphosphorylase/glucosamine-1-phosphate N-acetyltransferase [Proteobacteria bacterium]|nr:UDP-N-acetylglucosamine diphosphorylase/glucosamine-1-phosphate N-acetyltransferase [Pseudomonadota bacterium]
MALAVVMAAGLGTRMKSDTAKVLYPILGRPMIAWVVDATRRAGVREFVVVVGYQKDRVIDALKSGFPELRMEFAYQREQLGTAHAVMCARRRIREYDGDVLILCGDTPIIRPQTLKRFLRLHKKKAPAISIATGILTDPTGYGRVVRDEAGRIRKIVEETEARGSTKEIKEVNLGAYIVPAKLLAKYLPKIGRDNRKGEYFLTDLIELLAGDGKRVEPFLVEDTLEFLGINDRWQLARAQRILQERVAEKLARDGATLIAPDRIYIEPQVKVASDVVIWSDVVLRGKTKVGRGCEIGQGVVIVDSVLEEGVVVHPYSVIEGCRIRRGAQVGPFSRIRPKSTIGAGARVGNFVEVKNTRIGTCTKALHLSYLGDSVIGKGVNIGAGTITCNYDGFAKHQTVICDEAFIGSDSQLVAPVKVGRGAYIGSGSTITKDVPAGALAVARSEQKVFKGWVERKRRIMAKKAGKEGS